MEETRKKAVYRSSLRSQALIKRNLLVLMQEKSFDEITVTDIVRRANINRGTFYAHFHSTYEVLLKIQEDMFSELTVALEAYTPDSVMADPTPIFKRISEFLISDISYYKMLFKYTRVQEYLFDNKERIFRFFLASDIAKAIGEGQLRRKFISIIDFWISGIFNIYYDVVLEKIPMRLDEVPEFLAKVVNMSEPNAAEIMKYLK